MELSRCHHCDQFDAILETLGALMAGQASIDAAQQQIIATQAVEAQAVAIIGTDVTAIAAQLAAAGTVDTTALDAAVAAQPASDAALVSAVDSLTALVVPPPAAPAAPAAE